MKKYRRILYAIAVPIFLIGTAAPALAVDSATLVNQSKRYDGKTVTFTGEVIGNVMKRSDGVWVNVNDDPYSRQGRLFHLAGFNRGQSVLLPLGSADVIKRTGDYDNRGDLIEVQGIFREACPDHGGDMMIIAKTVRVVRPGFTLPHTISAEKISLALFWFVAAVTLALLWRWRLSRTRRRY
ncbi:MAG TPA: hypothetical protein ENI11_01685 [Actinobacteria bacterium]|nr:hypothetical protein [Actinomycetota bacterium]